MPTYKLKWLYLLCKLEKKIPFDQNVCAVFKESTTVLFVQWITAIQMHAFVNSLDIKLESSLPLSIIPSVCAISELQVETQSRIIHS